MSIKQIVENVKQIKFEPLYEKLNKEDQDKIEYNSIIPLGNRLPKSLIKFFLDKQVPIFITAFVLIFAIIISSVGLKLFPLTLPVFIVLIIIVFIPIISVMIGSSSSVRLIREQNFNRLNSNINDVAWDSANIYMQDLDDDVSAVIAQRELAHEFFNPQGLNHLQVTNDFDIGEIYAYQTTGLESDDDNNHSYTLRYSMIRFNNNLPSFRIEKRAFRTFSPMRSRKVLSGIKNFGLKYVITTNPMASDEKVQEIKDYLNTPSISEKILQIYQNYPNLLDIYFFDDHITFQWNNPISLDADTEDEVDRDIGTEFKMITKATLEIAILASQY